MSKNAVSICELCKIVNETAEKAYYFKINGQVDQYKKGISYLSDLIFGVRGLWKKNKSLWEKGRPDDLLSCAQDVFIDCIKSWKPNDAAFWVYFLSIFKKRSNNVYMENYDTYQRGAERKRKKIVRNSADLTGEEKAKIRSEIKRENFYDDPDGDSSVRNIAGLSNIENEALQSEKVYAIYNVLNNVVLGEKKRYENSPKICYPVYFYTEFVTRMIDESRDGLSVFDKSESSLMKVIDHNFIAYYLNGKNSSVEEIARGELKRLSAFSGNEEDDTPCGYDLKRIVYRKYVAKLKKLDELPSAASISQQHDKFELLIQMAMKNNYDNE